MLCAGLQAPQAPKAKPNHCQDLQVFFLVGRGWAGERGESGSGHSHSGMYCIACWKCCKRSVLFKGSCALCRQSPAQGETQL